MRSYVGVAPDQGVIELRVTAEIRVIKIAEAASEVSTVPPEPNAVEVDPRLGSVESEGEDEPSGWFDAQALLLVARNRLEADRRREAVAEHVVSEEDSEEFAWLVHTA